MYSKQLHTMLRWTCLFCPETRDVVATSPKSNREMLTTIGLQVAKLRTSMQEYENDKWRIISSKVGAGFSPAACKDKIEELKAIEAEQEEERQQQGSYELPGGHSDPSATSYQ